jgi:hypothetical protein
MYLEKRQATDRASHTAADRLLRKAHAGHFSETGGELVLNLV